MLFAIMRIDRAPESIRASAVDPIAPLHYVFAKRMADAIASSLLLVLLSPIFFLIAMLIWLDLPGPIFFVQKRVGRNGELFDMYKFRSMHTTAPRYDLSPTQSCDTRITAIGRFLRRSSLDELPQLINVFLGSMSLVGPRPEMPFIVRRYNSRQRQRLQGDPRDYRSVATERRPGLSHPREYSVRPELHPEPHVLYGSGHSDPHTLPCAARGDLEGLHSIAFAAPNKSAPKAT